MPDQLLPRAKSHGPDPDVECPQRVRDRVQQGPADARCVQPELDRSPLGMGQVLGTEEVIAAHQVGTHERQIAGPDVVDHRHKPGGHVGECLALEQKRRWRPRWWSATAIIRLGVVAAYRS